MFLSKYGVARHLYVPVVKRAVVDLAVGADWTPAAGDVKISKDGGAAANVTNLPVAIVMGNTAIWDFSFTATEFQAAQIVVTVADSATKAVEDQTLIIETYGHASAQHEFDLDTPTVALTAASITTATFAAGAINAAAIATDAIDDDAIATGAIASTAFAAGAITNAALAAGAISSGTFATGAINATALATGAITSVKIAASAIGASQLATDAIGSAQIAATAVTELQTGLATQASVDDLPTNAELATALSPIATAAGVTSATAPLATSAEVTAVSVFVDTEVATILAAVDTETAAILAAVDTEVATVVAGVAAIEADTQDIQARLPAALVSGRIDTSVGAMAANVLTASALAADAVAEIADGVLDEPIPEAGKFAWPGTLRTMIAMWGAGLRNKKRATLATGVIAVRNDADSADLFTYAADDTLGVFTVGESA